MSAKLHPATTMLRGDDSYCPCEIAVASLPAGRELLTGVFRDDGIPADSTARRPDRPFGLVIPPGFAAWQSLNLRIFRALQSTRREINVTVE